MRSPPTVLPPRAEPKVVATSALAAGRAAFNRHQFFAAHELWEDAWRRSAGTPRTILQGLIQIAAGLHHLHQNRTGPATRLLDKGVRKLQRATHEARSAGAFEAEVDPLARELAELELEVFAAAIARLASRCAPGPGPEAKAARIRVPRL